MTDTALQAIERSGDGYSLTVNTRLGTETLNARKVLLAVGREPVTDGLGLELAGIRHEAKGITVDETMATNVPGVYAIGDAAAPGYFLAHTAAHQGMVAAVL